MTVLATRRIAILFVLFLATMLTACGASGPAFKRMDPPMNGQGIVYIYRQPGHIGMGVHGTVRANGKAVTDIKNEVIFRTSDCLDLSNSRRVPKPPMTLQST